MRRRLLNGDLSPLLKVTSGASHELSMNGSVTHVFNGSVMTLRRTYAVLSARNRRNILQRESGLDESATPPCESSTQSRRFFSVGSSLLQSSTAVVEVEGSGKAELISKAMRAYIDRARSHGEFMEKQCAEFEVGKRHLARIMGKDPNDDFTQADIDSAISYLFPSGLFSPAARPFMRHPSQVFPKKKAPQFGWDGRPFHPLFYTGKPQFNQVLHDGRIVLEQVVEAAGNRRDQSKNDDDAKSHEQNVESMKAFVNSTKWMSVDSMRAMFLEKVSEAEHERFVNLGERIIEHTSSSYLAKSYLSKYRESIGNLVKQRQINEPMVDAETGVRYSIGTGSRKCSKAEVILREGTGKFLINGDPDGIDFFDGVLERLQILTPFSFLGRLGEFDVEAEVQGPSNSFVSSAGAIRIALCRALTAFCTPTEVEQMRLAGLLTEDPRVRERKIYGQAGARRKFRWNRR